MEQTPKERFDSCLLLAACLARRKAVPAAVTFDELLSAALEGVWRAARQFDPENGAKFSSYAASLIRFSMQEYLRSLQRGPRSSPQPKVHSLDDGYGDYERWDIEDEEIVPPLGAAIAKEQTELMLQALKDLREPHQMILRRYYFEGYLMREIGDELGVSDGRISQLHSRGLELMQYSLRRLAV